MRLPGIRRAVQRLLLVAFGLALSLVVLEVVMQLGAVAVGWVGRDPRAGWLSGERRVLSLGDSFTYGLFVERSEAYPEAFERLWNQSHGEDRIEVLNLGFPGANSFQVRNQFRRLLRTFTPDLVTVMVGANDYWTVRPEAEETSLGERIADAAFRHSRVFRLAFMLRRAVEKTELQVETEADDVTPVCPVERVESSEGRGLARFGDQTFDMGWRRGARGRARTDPASFAADLEANLRFMVTEARAQGADVVFLTYPTGVLVYAQASTALRRVAAQSGAKLVDSTPLFAPRCEPYWTCPILFPDQHPTAEGYRMIAEALFAALRSGTP